MNKLELITFMTSVDEFGDDLYNNLMDLDSTLLQETEETREHDYSNVLDMSISRAEERISMESYGGWVQEYNQYLGYVIEDVEYYLKDTFSDLEYSINAFPFSDSMIVAIAAARY